jgi:hypothetical protein
MVLITMIEVSVKVKAEASCIVLVMMRNNDIKKWYVCDHNEEDGPDGPQIMAINDIYNRDTDISMSNPESDPDSNSHFKYDDDYR